MSKYYCLYCKHYKPTQCGSEGTEPEGICCNPRTAIDYVYGHEYCEQYDKWILNNENKRNHGNQRILRNL